MIPLDRTKALELARQRPGYRGICAQCGCSDFNACTGLGFLEDESCSWANHKQTLCSNPECITKARGPQMMRA
jgi:hypothetical protein